MKKYYTTTEYKIFQKRKLNKLILKNKRVYRVKQRVKKEDNLRVKHGFRLQVIAPRDFRVIENTEECLNFFRNLRNEDFTDRRSGIGHVRMTLRNVEKIDYAAVSILTAISDDLKFNDIVLQGDLPESLDCSKFMIDSNFLNHMYNAKTAKRYRSETTSELIFFEKGCGKLSIEDNMKISKTIKNVVKHLTGRSNQCLSVKTIILEICGNSIEWADTKNKQWLLGVKYEDKKVIFTLTDVGRGILQTLHRRFPLKITDILSHKTDHQILEGAFEKKYGSSTKEANRNKGLPSIKANFEEKILSNLKVLTNNVILHFDNKSLSRTLDKGSPRFKGTFYQWEMTEECINNIR